MTPLTEVAHTLIRTILRSGDVAIDATVGNGHDTLFLADCVGPSGTVYGFDIQQQALAATTQRLSEVGLKHVVLFNRSHAELESALAELPRGGVRAMMFNLGYLPGGDKRLTTQVDSTIAAIQAALRLLSPGGIITILVYVGHAGGNEEAAAIEVLLNGLSVADYSVSKAGITEGRLSAPRLFVVRKR